MEMGLQELQGPPRVHIRTFKTNPSIQAITEGHDGQTTTVDSGGNMAKSEWLDKLVFWRMSEIHAVCSCILSVIFSELVKFISYFRIA